MRDLWEHPKMRLAMALYAIALAAVGVVAAIGFRKNSVEWLLAAVAVAVGFAMLVQLGALWAFVRLKARHEDDVEAWREQARVSDESLRAAIAQAGVRVHKDLGTQLAQLRTAVTAGEKGARDAAAKADKASKDAVAQSRKAAIEQAQRIDSIVQGRIDHLESMLREGLDRTGAEFRALRVRTDSAHERLDTAQDRLTTRLEQERNRTERMLASQETRAERTEARASEAHQVARTMKDELSRVERRAESLRDEIKRVESRGIDAKRELSRRVAGERSDRIVASARRDARGRSPARLALILCPPRTGSTWLFDALRSLPMVDFEPTPRLLQQLGMTNMNRYPSGLWVEGTEGVEAELSPGRGAIVPELDADGLGHELESTVSRLERCSIEKIHPNFFDFDAARFLEQAESFERTRGVALTMLYRLRDPEMAIRSMARYKMRDEGWYRFVDWDDVPAHYERNLRIVARVMRDRPGLVSLYEDHRANGRDALAGLLRGVWTDLSSSDAAALADSAQHAVDRSKRAGTTAFLAAKTSDEDHADERVEALLASNRAALESCREIQAGMRAIAAQWDGSGATLFEAKPANEPDTTPPSAREPAANGSVPADAAPTDAAKPARGSSKRTSKKTGNKTR